jgi:AcrR family transcriptional regulator
VQDVRNLHTDCTYVNHGVVTRRRQADRTAATRTALLAAARQLFTEHGYAEVGTEQIARTAGVTRGALYHQFADKEGLFAAVLEEVETDLTARLIAAVAAAPTDDAGALLAAGAQAWLDASTEPEVRRIALVDGPAVLGYDRWREVGERHGLGLVTGLLTELMDADLIPTQPIGPLARVLIGALDEAALYVALAEDPARARSETSTVLIRLLTAIVDV